MTNNGALYIGSLCAAATLVLIWEWRRSKTKLPFPPGPKRLPLLGNALDVPTDVPIWQTFTSMARKYNAEVLYLKLLATDFVILNSSAAVSDLTEKRSNIYSDRPLVPMLDLMGQYSWATTILKYGNQWRNARRLLHEFLNVRAVTRFDEYQRKHTRRLLLRLVESSDGFLHHTEFAVAALVMEITYGMNIVNNEDPFLRAATAAVDAMKQALVPGAFLVDTVPILKYVPERFPGAGFKTFARVARGRFDVAVNGPFDYVKESMKSDEKANASIAWTCLTRSLESSSKVFEEDEIRGATATLFMAAVETTVSVLQIFFLAMALNPHTVRKAQEELDRVVGGERLPDFSDQEGLPYISAIVKEVLRWGCPTPIGVAKRVMEDDVYNGYFIPAGATIIENVWAMLHDEAVYPAPYTFNPERYLKDGKLDHSVKNPEERIFGSGRRICPGRHFAVRTMFLNIACILALFDIEAPANEKLEAHFPDTGMVRQPTPFRCTIRPRSEASLKLARTAYAATDR